MTGRIWDRFLTERDQEVFATSGYGREAGFGARPAFLIVDVNYNFLGARPEKVTDSIRTWRNSCGAEGWAAVGVIRQVIEACRARNLPIFFSTNSRRPDGWDCTSRKWKNYRALENYEQENRGNRIVDEIAPQPQDIVIVKAKPSVFFGTPLLSYLIYLKVDTLIVAGVATSGCVRATVTDAFSNNFRVTMVEDGCFDRSEASHAINLRDLDAKYADVLASREVIARIRTVPDNLFELPTGDVVST
ncbi:MAG: isochorismatase family protein [Acetobacteraceae bacterium]